MRCLWLALGPLLIVSPTASRAAEPEAIVERAIKAIDGEGQMAAAKGMHREIGGKLKEGYLGVDIIEMQDLDHFSMDEVVQNAESRSVVYSQSMIIGGDEGWGETEYARGMGQMPADSVKAAKWQCACEMIPVNPALLKNKIFKLEFAGRALIDGKPAETLKITGPTGGSFLLSFDVESGFPVRKMFTNVINGKETSSVTLYSAYSTGNKDYGAEKVNVAQRIRFTGTDGESIERGLQNFMLRDSYAADAFGNPHEKKKRRP